MDRSTVGDETFLGGVVEVGTVIDGSGVGFCSTENGRLPGVAVKRRDRISDRLRESGNEYSVQMRVEVNDGDGTVDGVNRSENG